MDPAVIGRERIDNYMLSIPHQRPETEEDQEYMVGTMDSSWKSKGHLLDTSYKSIFKLKILNSFWVTSGVGWISDPYPQGPSGEGRYSVEQSVHSELQTRFWFACFCTLSIP